jgi:hypothetical protein
MNRSSNWRSAIVLLIGVAFGGLIGFWLGRTGHHTTSTQTDSETKSQAGPARVKLGNNSPFGTGTDESRVSLGNITTVPFSELYSVLSALPEEKLNELAAQLNQLPNDKQSAAKIATFFKAWAHIDPKAALRAAITFKSSEAKPTAIAAVIESADVTQAEALARAIKEWPDGVVTRGQRNNFLVSAMTKWAQIAPVEAAKFYDSTPLTTARFSWAASTIAQSWAALDPQAALAWAQTHSDAESYSTAVNAAVCGWWSKDHAAAEAYALAHLSDQSGRQLASSLATHIYATDPERAKQWVMALPDQQARQQSANILTMQMAWSDPKGASEWAVTLPSDVRDTSLREAMHYWAASDAPAAADWINGLSGALRDQATSAYATTLVRKNPATAAEWAMTISDAKTRDNSLDRIASEWLRKNTPDATAWIQSSALSAQQKQRLLALAPKG